ncbi:MAG TPA: ATP-binding protein [Ktedonobacteraceae bacterium]|nr:ATP-binding protein [Ktedonobacteraceae bacterium]
MDTVQFGRWFSERRRANGWHSQRALAQAAREDAFLRDCGVSEDFVARLEAGQLVHPFRGAVRQRVLMLTWLLCKTQRDIRAYLRAAELTELTQDEMKQISRLGTHLAALHDSASAIPLILPPRPSRFIGQDAALQELSQALHTREIVVYAVTGMPGIGKSALVNEAVHRLAANEHERLLLFPDGIATFTGKGRHGTDGLMSLLQEIIAVFRPSSASGKQAKDTSTQDDSRPRFAAQSDLAHTLDSARAAVANKHMLLVIDNLEADFPLRQALEIFLAGPHVENDTRKQVHTHEIETASERCLLLFTSRYIPSPALVPNRLHVPALTLESALELFALLLGRAHFAEAERFYAGQICSAVGCLPLAIEVAATAVVARGIPLALLAACAAKNPLDRLLDGEQEIYSMLERAFDALGSRMRDEFALLSILGTSTFGLNAAASLRIQLSNADLDNRQLATNFTRELLETRELVAAHSGDSGRKPTRPLPEHYHGLPVREVHDSGIRTLDTYNQSESRDTNDSDLINLANTATELGQFVRHSLLELKPDDDASSPLHDCAIVDRNSNDTTRPASARYWIHPLLRAYAEEQSKQLPSRMIDTAQRNIQSYALSYIEQYGKDSSCLEREQGLLLSALRQSWQEGQYGRVVHILSALLPLTHCLHLQEGERLLQWGLLAGQKVSDQHAIARFLAALGTLRCHHGEMRGAREALEKSMEIAETLNRPVRLWHSLGNLSHVAHILGENDAARHFAEAFLQRARQADDDRLLAEAHYHHAFYARIQGDKDIAFEDLRLCMQLLSQSKQMKPGGSLFEMQVWTELARVQDDYANSLKFSESAISLLACSRGSYYIADILYDQACFAFEQGQLDDAGLLARRTIEMATQIGAHHFRANSMKLLQKLS